MNGRPRSARASRPHGLARCVGGAMLLATWVAPASAQSDALPVATGWYETTDGRRMLVSPGPVAGYRHLDFGSADFGSLVLAPPSGSSSEDAYRIVTSAGDSVRAMRSPDGEAWRRASDPSYALEEVSFSGGGEVELAGLVLRPERPEVGAALVHGSGDSDRDNVWAYTFAHALAEAGVCVLFPDKRGSGGSGGDWRTVGFDALARDAVAAAREVARRCDLDLSRVGWVGLSQGGWIAPLAHRFAGDGAFVISVSSAAVAVFDQMAHEAMNTLASSGLGSGELVEARRFLEAVRNHATGRLSWDGYAVLRDSLRTGPIADFASAMPDDAADWRWSWWNRVGRYDPILSWAASRVPVLVVYGERDEEDNVPVRRSVERLERLAGAPGVPPIDVVVFPGLGHALVDEETGWVHAGALDRIVSWVVEPGGGR